MDKYYNSEGRDSGLLKLANAESKPVIDEPGKSGTVTTKYADWIVQ